MREQFFCDRSSLLSRDGGERGGGGGKRGRASGGWDAREGRVGWMDERERKEGAGEWKCFISHGQKGDGGGVQVMREGGSSSFLLSPRGALCMRLQRQGHVGTWERGRKGAGSCCTKKGRGERARKGLGSPGKGWGVERQKKLGTSPSAGRWVASRADGQRPVCAHTIGQRGACGRALRLGTRKKEREKKQRLREGTCARAAVATLNLHRAP